MNKQGNIITEAVIKTFFTNVLIFFTLLSCIHLALKEQQRPVVKHYTIVQNTKFPADFAGMYTLTAYCACPKCVGYKKQVRTATGTIPRINRTVAVDPSVIPYGSIIYIENMGYYIAEDCGGKVKGNRIDIFMATHNEALKFGKQTRNVWIMKKES